MAFTFEDGLATDRDKVRFYTGDTDSNTSLLSDEMITGLITLETDYQGAVIAAIEYLLVKINREPDTTADWLRVAWGGSREGLERQLERLKAKWRKGTRRLGSRQAVRRHDTRVAGSGQSELEDLLDDLYS